MEESKSAIKGRYGTQNEGEEIMQSETASGLLTESQLQGSAKHNKHGKLKLQASQQLVEATKNEPHGLNEKMLAGQGVKRK